MMAQSGEKRDASFFFWRQNWKNFLLGENCGGWSVKTMVAASPSRKLEIQCGVLKRTLKDISAYQKEFTEMKEQIQRATPDQPYQQWQKVLEETERMVSDSYRRLSEAVDSLQKLQTQMENLRGTKEWEQADALLQEAQQVLSQTSKV
jgi:molecular chaperone GrpE (heat shock protein)